MDRRRFLAFCGTPAVRITGVGATVALSCQPSYAAWIPAINLTLAAAERFSQKGPNGLASMMSAVLSNQQIILDQLASMQRQLTDIQKDLAELKAAMPEYIDAGFEADYYRTAAAMSSSMRGYVAEDQAGIVGPNSLDSVFERFEYDAGILRGKLAAQPGLLSAMAMPLVLGIETFALLRRKRLIVLKEALSGYEAWIADSQRSEKGRKTLQNAMTDLSRKHKELLSALDKTEVFPAALEPSRSSLVGSALCVNGQQRDVTLVPAPGPAYVRAISSYGAKFRLERRISLQQTPDEVQLGYLRLTVKDEMVEYPDWLDAPACHHKGYHGENMIYYMEPKDSAGRIKQLTRAERPLPVYAKSEPKVKAVQDIALSINNYRAQFAVHARALGILQACADRIAYLRAYLYA